MKFFIDTGDIKEIEALATLGIIDGVTTNPSLMAKQPLISAIYCHSYGMQLARLVSIGS